MGTRRLGGGPGLQDRTEDGGMSTILEALGDEESRAIIIATIRRSMTIEEICIETGIPLSTGYRKTRALARRGLIAVESMSVARAGTKSSRYRCVFANLTFNVSSEKVSIEAVVNPALKAKAERDRMHGSP